MIASCLIASALHAEGTYIKILRNFYFPLLVRFHRNICVLWIVIFVVCVIYGPAFLNSTRSNLDLPAGTPSAAAVKAFQTLYPDLGRSALPSAVHVWRQGGCREGGSEELERG